MFNLVEIHKYLTCKQNAVVTNSLIRFYYTQYTMVLHKKLLKIAYKCTWNISSGFKRAKRSKVSISFKNLNNTRP